MLKMEANNMLFDFQFPKCKYQFRPKSNEVFEYAAVYKLPDDFTISKNGDAFR